MFFALSKILGQLTMPLVLVSIVFGVSFLLKRPRLKQQCRRLSLVMLIFFSNEFIVNGIMRWWEPDPIPFASISRTYDVGILLCGMASPPSEPFDRVHFSGSTDRLIHTLQLYKLGKIREILISGGEGRLLASGQNEARDLRTTLLMMGVPDSVIVVEGKSRNTHESADEVSLLLKQKKGPVSCLLITSAYHMRRSLACFQKAGLQPDTFPTDQRSVAVNFQPDHLLLPQSNALGLWQVLLKEWVGIVAYRLAGYI